MRTAGPSSPRHESLLYGDCLEVMAGWRGEIVDLIYLDPPFNSNQEYRMLFGTANGGRAQVRAFSDTWYWTAEAVDRVDRLTGALAHPAHKAMIAFKELLGPSGMLAYLSYMAERLAEMHRLLKPEGSVYLHCDDTAVHYLKLLMDDIFGSPNYRNHLVWRRATAHSDSKRYGRIVDHLLFYSRTANFYWAGDEVRTIKQGSELKKAYPSRDGRGRYRTQDLTGPLHGAALGAPSTLPWKGYDVHSLNRCWSVPKTGSYAEYIEQEVIPGYRQIEGIHDRLDALDAAGAHPPPGDRSVAGIETLCGSRPGHSTPEPDSQPHRVHQLQPRTKRQGIHAVRHPEATRPDRAPDQGFLSSQGPGAGSFLRVWNHRAGRSQPGTSLGGDRHIAAGGGHNGEETDRGRGPAAAGRSALRSGGGAPDGRRQPVPLRDLGDHPRSRPDAQREPAGRPGHRREGPVGGGQETDRGGPGQGPGTKSAVRDFLGVLTREDALGVFVTLERPPQAWAAEAAEAGRFRLGAESYPRCQMWSIEEFFEGSRPHLPAMLDPLTGKPIQFLTARLTDR